MRINAYCSYCRRFSKKNGIYTITIENSPFKEPSNDDEYVTVRVRHTDHMHEKVAESITTDENSNGSTQSVNSLQSLSPSKSSSSAQSSISTSSNHSTKSSYSSEDEREPFEIKCIHQITGSEREMIAKEMLAEYNGSAVAYRKALIARKAPNIASKEVYRKILSEYSHKNDISSNWSQNLLSSASSFDALLKSAKMSGYIQQFEQFPTLSIGCFMEKQLECIHRTAYNDRILHVDAIGSLVKIGEKQNNYKFADYKRILNYCLLLKNKKHLGANSGNALVGEYITSCHDVKQLSKFFLEYRYTYEQVYNEKLNFRLIITDLTWTIIHSLLREFNDMDVIQYSNMVLKVAKGEALNTSISWLLSSASHTMKRFSYSLKSLSISDSNFRYICYCFSLLLNSTNLELCVEYFRLICIVFLTKSTNQMLIDSKHKIKTALASRPDIKDDLIAKSELDTSEINGFSNRNEADSSDGESDGDDHEPYNPFKQDSIKFCSPFAKIFKDVYEKVSAEVLFETNGGDSNCLYCPKLIELLLDNYMPYCFMWSGFVLRDTGLARLVNGSLENYIEISKKNVTKNQLPNQYINKSFDLVNSYAIEYLSTVDRLETKNQLMTLNYKRKATENDISNIEEKKKRTEVDVEQKPNGIGYQKKEAIQLDDPHNFSLY